MPPLTYDGAERRAKLACALPSRDRGRAKLKGGRFFVPMQRQQLLAGSLPIDPNNPSPHQW